MKHETNYLQSLLPLDDGLHLDLLHLIRRFDNVEDVDAVQGELSATDLRKGGKKTVHSASTVLRTPACHEQMPREVGGA